MAVTAEQLDEFQQFAQEKIRNGGSDLSLDELVELWMSKNMPREELEESLHAMEEGIADAKAGRVRPAADVARDLSARYSAEPS